MQLREKSINGKDDLIKILKNRIVVRTTRFTSHQAAAAATSRRGRRLRPAMGGGPQYD